MNKNQVKKDCFEYFKNTSWATIALGKIIFFENRIDLFKEIMIKNFPVLKYSSYSYDATFGKQVSVTIID